MDVSLTSFPGSPHAAMNVTRMVPQIANAATAFDTAPLPASNYFVIEDTPRYDIGGITEVVMAAGNRIAQLTWRPSPKEIVTDVVRDYFVRHCEREYGEATYAESDSVQVWSWTTWHGLRAVVSEHHAQPGSVGFFYIEQEAQALSTFDVLTS
jgi:hypothetical protein